MEMCQATRMEPATTMVSWRRGYGRYCLSEGAEQRVRNFALRPREWFNLAVIAGPNEYYLRGDYDENGVAQEPVNDGDQFPAPTLSQCAPFLDRLIEYARTRRELGADVIATMRGHDGSLVLGELRKQFAGATNIWIRGRLLELGAAVLGEGAAELFYCAIEGAKPSTRLVYLGRAGGCLGMEEGRLLGQEWLEGVDPHEQARLGLALAQYRSPAVLDWIEEHARHPMAREWGAVAADCGAAWPRIQRWLRAGPELGMLAVQTLLEYRGHGWALHPFAGQVQPRLRNAPAIERIEREVREFAERQPIVRARLFVEKYMGCLRVICGLED